MNLVDSVSHDSITYAYYLCKSRGQTGQELVWIEFAMELIALENL